MADFLNIGLTGLMAAQAKLTVASHNIANADTPGYSRQSTVQTTQPSQYMGYGYVGQGARVVDVQRSYDQFLHRQLLQSQSQASYYQSYRDLIAPIDDLIADPDLGVSSAMAQFFDSVNEVANNPSSIPARQTMLSQSEALVNRFHLLSDRIEEIDAALQQNVSLATQQITQYGQQIARLNQEITRALGVGNGAAPNDLLDQRDQALAELSKLVNVHAVVDDRGIMNVFIGNGQALVQGMESATLATRPDPAQPMRTQVTYQIGTGAAQILPEQLITGGELGAMLAFRRDTLEPVQDQLGFLALALAVKFNEVHASGYGLDGSTGSAYFSGIDLSQPVETTGSAGSTVTVPFASSVDLGALRPDTYILSNTNGTLTVTRQSDGKVFDVSANSVIDGLDFSGVTLQTGETAVISPYRNAASKIGVAITDPRQIAAAEEDPTGTLAPGSGPADNRNALALAAIQTDKFLYANASGQPTATLQSVYARTVSAVGAKASEVINGATASQALHEQIRAQRDSLAGVNLDEEAANLIRFQQAYLAASKVMQMSQRLFDSVLAIAS
ncbi:flagellar hook-associated protein FlgK [Tepidiphilus baoligensis]|uniref:Flagellar hook-associated protein 1 n=1 Tax=Tepidiphilus baoligensis TaxID=2698687 RepID=A0ABX1QMX5_9PROT|nr:flagellar hook-associated protein FlgK [Tepidiphilus baoligensis]NMH16636.1 flagellar hook-associated protein FlgK [Tepidiphilus baoligensis]